MDKQANAMDQLADLITRQSGNDSAHMAAIMMLMAVETERDSDFPERARIWFDKSIGSFVLEGKNQDEAHKQQLVYARAHFQLLLSSAVKIAKQKKTATTQEPPSKSWWRKFWGKMT